MGADACVQPQPRSLEKSDALAAVWVSAPSDRLHVNAHAGIAQPAVEDAGDWEVPTVDLSRGDEAAAAQLHSAASSVGFFYVSGHGVSEECLQRQFQESRRFFELPLAEKLRVRADSSNRGYHPYGIGTAKNPYQQLDRKEAWNGYLGWEDDAVDTPFRGRNCWPDEELLPDFRTAMTQYYHEMNGVADRLLQLIAIGLQLPEDFFDSYFDAAISNIRTIRYLPGQHRARDGVFGVGAHTDWGMLTVLATDPVPGLQIFHAGAWRDVPPRPGCFVVNVGDLLHRWTGGAFLSTLHRVEKRDAGERYSAPFFCAPNLDAVIEVLEPCAAAAEREGRKPSPARGESVTCGDWLAKRRAAEYGSKPQLNIT